MRGLLIALIIGVLMVVAGWITFQNYGDHDDLPILMLSSAERIRLEQQGSNLHISAFLEKPVSQSALREAIATSLGHKPSAPPSESQPNPQTTHPLVILITEDTLANQKDVQTPIMDGLQATCTSATTPRMTSPNSPSLPSPLIP